MEIKRTYRNPAGDAKRTMIWEDNDPDTVHVYTKQDVTKVVEENKFLRDHQDLKSTHRVIARGVPITVAEKAMLEQWDERKWAQWLNDPDNRVFRVWQGWV